jgi:hypothetical protein
MCGEGSTGIFSGHVCIKYLNGPLGGSFLLADLSFSFAKKPVADSRRERESFHAMRIIFPSE